MEEMNKANSMNSFSADKAIPYPGYIDCDDADNELSVPVETESPDTEACNNAQAFDSVTEIKETVPEPLEAIDINDINSNNAFAPALDECEPEPKPKPEKTEPPEVINTPQAFSSVSEIPKAEENARDEAAHVFAQGLPDWDIVPPQVMVRRH